MEKVLTALVAAALVSMIPTTAESLVIGPGGKSIHWHPPRDEVKWINHRVIRRVTYNDVFVQNPACPQEYVPALWYSAVSKKGESIDDMVRLFEDAGALPPNSKIPTTWGDYAGKPLPADYVFELSRAGPCSSK